MVFEILILAAASYYLTRTLLPHSPNWIGIAVALFAVSSYGRNMNLARFHQPVVYGLYYCFADGFRIFGIAFAIRKRYFLAFLFLALSFMTHPMMGFFAIVFVFAYQLAQSKERNARNFWIAAVCAGVVCLLWVFTTLNPSGISSENIPRDLWFGISEMTSYHWYPISFGIFSLEHAHPFFPFLSFLILFCFFYIRDFSQREDCNALRFAFLAILSLIAAGVFFSVAKFSPALVKMAFHRANDILLIVAFPFVIWGLCQRIQEGKWGVKILSLGILLSPFLFDPGFPILLTLSLLALELAPDIQAKQSVLALCKQYRASMALVGIFFLTIAIYYFTSIPTLWSSAGYIGNRYFFWIILGATVLAVILGISLLARKEIPTFPVLAICLGGSVFWSSQYPSNRPFLPTELRPMAADYKALQLWARENTAPNSLFMSDPSISYGWRDYSQRSSFGNFREWVFSSWSYDGELKVFNDSMQRIAEFGLNVRDFIGRGWPLSGYQEMNLLVEKHYDSASDEWRQQLAAKYGIDFFVMNKKKMKAKTELPIAYENEHFLLLKGQGK